MEQPRTLTDRDRDSLINTPNYTLQHGQAQLTAGPAADGEERRFIMTGPSGTHSILILATDAARLNAHWQTFCSHPLNAHVDERLLNPTAQRRASLEKAISEATGLPIQITIRGPREFTFSTDEVSPDLEDKIRAFLGWTLQLETHHDEETGSFCYATV